MTVLLRSFFVWLLLLAVPYQGYASATMMLCAASAQATVTAGQHPMTMPAGAHDHAAMMAAQAHDGRAHGGDAKSSHAHNVMKCGGSACCAAAAPVLAHAMAVPTMPSSSSAVSFYSAFLPAIHPDHPERPPQGNRA
jgi:hypothetical protein